MNILLQQYIIILLCIGLCVLDNGSIVVFNPPTSSLSLLGRTDFPPNVPWSHGHYQQSSE